jgi:hypothetical protein
METIKSKEMLLINGVHHHEESYKEIKVKKIFCTPISSSSNARGVATKG